MTANPEPVFFEVHAYTDVRGWTGYVRIEHEGMSVTVQAKHQEREAALAWCKTTQARLLAALPILTGAVIGK